MSEYNQQRVQIKSEFSDNYHYPQHQPTQKPYQQYDYYATNAQYQASSHQSPHTPTYNIDASTPATPQKTAADNAPSTVSSDFDSIDDTTTSSLLDDIINYDEFYSTQNSIYDQVRIKFNSIEQIENELKSYCVQNKLLIS
jgi:hypothetical protein